MSKTAPWIALAVDWVSSEMFDDATDGERLAWICLLCHVKQCGRGGKAKVRQKAFAKTYDLSARSVECMFSKAQKCGSITIDAEDVTLINWRAYQDPAYKANGRVLVKSLESEKSPQPITHHQPHNHIETTNVVSFSEIASPSSETTPEAMSEFSFSVDGQQREWTLPLATLERYQRDYTTIDVPLELRKAWQWLDANPQKRKTAQGMRVFLTKWLSRAVDRPKPTAVAREPLPHNSHRLPPNPFRKEIAP